MKQGHLKQLQLHNCMFDMRNIFDGLEPATLEEITLTRCWKEWGWFSAALEGRVFTRVCKIDLQDFGNLPLHSPLVISQHYSNST